MSHFLAWKKHYKPKYKYLTLDFCVLTVAIGKIVSKVLEFCPCVSGGNNTAELATVAQDFASFVVPSSKARRGRG